MSNELEYARLRKLLAAATQGPFSHRATPSGQHAVTSSLGDVLVSTFPPINAACDVVAIAAVMNAAPALLDEFDRLRAELARVQQECERLREYEQKWNALQEAVRKLSDLHERATRIANAPQMHPPVMLDAKAPPA